MGIPVYYVLCKNKEDIKTFSVKQLEGLNFELLEFNNECCYNVRVYDFCRVGFLKCTNEKNFSLNLDNISTGRPWGVFIKQELLSSLSDEQEKAFNEALKTIQHYTETGLGCGVQII